MLFGFGDDEQPYAETVDLLEDLVIEYITDTVRGEAFLASELPKCNVYMYINIINHCQY